MSQDLEVLVHLAAPISKKSDDNQNRLAQASVGFPVSNRVQLARISTRWRETNHVPDRSPSIEIIPNPNGSSSPKPGQLLSGQRKGTPNLDDYYIEDDTEAAAALESQLLTSSINGSFNSISDHPANTVAQEHAIRSTPKSNSPEPRSHDSVDQDNDTESNDTESSSQESVIVSTLASIAPPPTSPFPRTFTHLPRYAIPPSVPVGIASPSTSLFGPTEILANIGKRLHNRYCPASQTRKISRKERGAWIVRTDKWPEGLQIEFFAVLARFIQSGACGYGMSAYRTPPTRSSSLSQDRSSQGSAVNLQNSGGSWENRVLGSVQVFCFGEMVREVYLLMWIASASKIRIAEAFWIDSKGKTIIKTR